MPDTAHHGVSGIGHFSNHLAGDLTELPVQFARQEEGREVDARQLIPVGRLGARAHAVESGRPPLRVARQPSFPLLAQPLGRKALLGREDREFSPGVQKALDPLLPEESSPLPVLDSALRPLMCSPEARRGSLQDEPPHPMGVLRGQTQRQAPTHGIPQEVESLDSQFVEGPLDAGQYTCEGLARGGPRSPMPGQIQRQDLAPAGERAQKGRSPTLTASGEPVQENQRRVALSPQKMMKWRRGQPADPIRTTNAGRRRGLKASLR